MTFTFSTSTNPNQVLIDFLKWKRENKLDWQRVIVIDMMAGDEYAGQHLESVECQAMIFADNAELFNKIHKIP